MSQVKISELPEIPHLNANTSQSLAVGVDLVTGITGKYTLKTLAEGLYSNEVLNVGNNSVIFPNVIGQFVSSADPYLQINLQNTDGNGSSDLVITSDVGTDTDGFVDLGINGSTFNQPAYTSMDKLDGYLFAVGPSDNQNKGNLVIGTAATNANVVFAVGGTLRENIVARFTSTGLVLNTQSSITFADGTRQTTAGSSVANTVLLQGIDTYQNNNITIVQGGLNTANANIALLIATNGYQNTVTSAAFTKANNALANTTGTFGGNLTVTGNVIATGIQSTTGAITTGNLIVNGTSTMNGTANISGTLNVVGAVSMNATLVLANSNFLSTESALTITATPTVATPANDGYMIHISGKNGIPARIVTDSYGTGSYALYAGRTARGTVSAPTAIQANDVISRYSSSGYGTTKYQALGTGRIDFVATENYTDANTGSQIKFYNCPVGSNTLTNIATFNGASVEFSGTVIPSKGFIYLPKTFNGAQTAITIDFANDTILRAQTATGLTVTLSNFVYGKVVEMWITNTSGNGQTFTHGCAAINSTVNSTTYSIPATSSILAKYMSFDGDVGNTFVSIIHS